MSEWALKHWTFNREIFFFDSRRALRLRYLMSPSRFKPERAAVHSAINGNLAIYRQAIVH